MVASIVFDQETYSVEYGIFETMMLLGTVNMTGSTELSTINEVFSVNITRLTPFTRYYYILTATNSFGSTSSAATLFTTMEAGTYAIIIMHVDICVDMVGLVCIRI